MVARIIVTANLGQVLRYNEKKVAQNKAELLHAQNFVTEKERLTPRERLDTLSKLNELNTRARFKTLHITLNFHPSDRLSTGELTAISDRYMQGLKMEDQPYLVYQHHDSAHPHLHIVTSLIRPDDTRISSHNMATRLSEPARKSMEREFQLAPARGKKIQLSLDNDPAAPAQSIQYDGTTLLTEAMNRVLETVTRDYRFTTFGEYNAVLRSYNLSAERGGPDSQTRRHKGLLYRALDDEGKKVGPGIKASRLPARITLVRLEQLFRLHQPSHAQDPQHIRSQLDWALLQRPASFPELAEQLRPEGIFIDWRPGSKGHPPTLHLVDHRQKFAVDAAALGPAYQPSKLQQDFQRQQYLEQQQAIQQDLRRDPTLRHRPS